jgi:hypothetical protein
LDDVAAVLGTRQIFQLPSAGLALSRAINEGKPLLATQPRAPYSRTVAALAEHIRSLATEG